MKSIYCIKLRTIIIILIVASSILVTIYNIKKTIKEETKIVSADVEKYEIFVDVEESKLYLLKDGNLIKTYLCSGGKWSTPSPIGIWTIVEKAKWGEGFGGSWMRIKCTVGTIRNTWNFKFKFNWLGKLSWMHKNEK